MDRTIFEPEHKEFRAAVATYLERSITPQLERYIDDRLIDRAAWEEAGEQGFLGLEVPEEYGGSLAQDYRFNTI